MRKTVLAAAFAGLAATVPAGASESPLLQPGDRQIPVDEWIDMVEGRTVYYFIEGRFFGQEYYFPGNRFARFQHVSGVCLEGTWDYRPRDFAYCYHWGHDSPCFQHVEREGEIKVLILDPGPDTVLEEQTVMQVVDGGFSCEGGFTS
ncbi:MAG: hypothetical protein ACPGID_14030 [Rubricella sp.]